MAAPTFGTRTSFTLSANSLANGSARQSAAVNLGTPVHDVLVGGSVKTASGTLSTTTPYVNLYAYAKTDSGNYSGGASGSDAAYTVPTEWQLKLVGTYRFDTAATIIYVHPTSLARLFGGVMPSDFGLVLHNACGLALDSSAGASFNYQTVTF